MDRQELEAKVGRLIGLIEKASATAATKTDEQMSELIGLGLAIVGELLVDIKRIADAAERKS